MYTREPAFKGGKLVKSTDPRKAKIVAALKQASGCSKITNVKEHTDGEFSADCLEFRGGRGDGKFQFKEALKIAVKGVKNASGNK